MFGWCSEPPKPLRIRRSREAGRCLTPGGARTGDDTRVITTGGLVGEGQKIFVPLSTLLYQ